MFEEETPTPGIMDKMDEEMPALLCAVTDEKSRSVQQLVQHKDTQRVLTRRRPNCTIKSGNEVVKWVSYIQGNGRNPKLNAPTLISCKRPERAAYKPLVAGMIEGLQSKTFFGTGAELNVVDETFMKML